MKALFAALVLLFWLAPSGAAAQAYDYPGRPVRSLYAGPSSPEVPAGTLAVRCPRNPAWGPQWSGYRQDSPRLWQRGKRHSRPYRGAGFSGSGYRSPGYCW